MADIHQQLLERFFPESRIGGFTYLDGTLQFYNVINAIITPEFRVLDFGAGRACWYEDDPSEYRKSVRLLKGKVAEVVACDVDEAILQNRASDQQIQLTMGEPLPFDDASFDLVVSDWTFEHFDEPDFIASELNRILKPGGWVCGRTPSKWGYVAIAARLVANKNHANVLKWFQPHRKEEDVFPTVYKLNTRKDLAKYFSPEQWEHHIAFTSGEPSYGGSHPLLWRALIILHRLLPGPLNVGMHIFMQKRVR